MADKKTDTVVEEAQPKTEADLLAQMNEATASGDFKLVAKVAQELVKFQKEKEQAEKAAREAAVAGLTEEVANAILAAINPFIEDGRMDEADGVWFTLDFTDSNLKACRLLKNAPKKSAGGGGNGGGGKKFSIGTTELLEAYGSEEYKDGMTYAEAWESNADKNWRYGIREKLLKRHGLTS